MKNRFASLGLALLSLAGLPSLLHAQSTAFTYQGKLEQNGQPATGIYKMAFRLYDRELGGSPLKTFAVNSTPVTNGLFTVNVDLEGVGLLAPDAWMDILVVTNGPGAMTLLEPRTRLTATPTAHFARIAGSVTNQSIRAEQLATTGTPGAGKVLGFDGTSLTWQAAAGGNSAWVANGTNLFYNNGRVGVGTQNPAAKLHVAQGGFAVTGASSPYTSAGRGIFMEGYQIFGTLFAYDYTSSRPLPLLLNHPGGNVGVGTTAPRSPLEVFGNWDGEFGTMNIAGRYPTIRLTGDAQTADHSWIMHMGSFRPGNLEFYRRVGSQPWVNSMTLDQNGNVGIGSLAPESKLEIIAQDALKLAGYQPFLTLMDFSSGNTRSRIQSVGGELILEAETFLNGSKPHAYAKLNNDGNFSVASLTIRGGADLAEPFPMDESIEEGSVVVIDEDQAGRLKLSTQAYDRQVAGIVSGANGINPGISLKQEGALDEGRNVALTGRVYVKADARYGAIKPGDLLTTSDVPGHAMKVLDHTKAQGAILGKAMTALAVGQGTVLVLVTLQ